MGKRKPLDLRKAVFSGYFVSLAGYTLVGLVGFLPAEAMSYDVSASINIPAINLTSDVTELELINNKLDTPDTIVGSFASAENKTFLVGHASTVFQDLKNIEVGNEINYNNKTYVVKNTTVLAKSEISMKELLSPAKKDTLIVMTCSGNDLGNGDATHRLIVTAEIQQ